MIHLVQRTIRAVPASEGIILIQNRGNLLVSAYHDCGIVEITAARITVVSTSVVAAGVVAAGVVTAGVVAPGVVAAGVVATGVVTASVVAHLNHSSVPSNMITLVHQCCMEIIYPIC